MVAVSEGALRGEGWSYAGIMVYCSEMSSRGIYRGLIAALLMLGLACFGQDDLEKRFLEPAKAGSRLSVTMRLDPSCGDTADSVLRRLERLRELGAGGVLVSLPVADERVWGLLGAAAEWCRKTGTELGLCDFWQSAEEAAGTPHLQTLAWSSRRVAGGALATNLLPLVYGPGGTYREIARLAVPEAVEVLPHQVRDLAVGGPSAEGEWRAFWFGHRDREPALVDLYQESAVFRHVNEGLVELQSRLKKSYGTVFVWYQFGGVDGGELVWPADIESLFLRQGGVPLKRSLPVFAGVPVGGEQAAAHVRQVLAAVLREAWRTRFAANVRDLVQESGLEAGHAVGAAPVEPDEVALYFRRPMLSVARSGEERERNARAAGGARTLARRFILGRLSLASVKEAPSSVLLPFPFKHEMDGLFGDGATRILLEPGDSGLSDGKVGAQLRLACLYAQRCQLLLQHGEPAADLLVWAERRPEVLEAYSCDEAGLKVIASAVVKGGRLCFDSERSYGALAVSDTVLSDPAAERLARQLAERGLRVFWVASRGRREGESMKRPFGELAKGEDLGVAPDLMWQSAEPGVRLRFLHRRSAEREVYFVMNGGEGGGVATCTFRDTGKGVPERWDPLEGEIGSVQEFERRPDGRAAVPLYLGPHDACFVVFER